MAWKLTGSLLGLVVAVIPALAEDKGEIPGNRLTKKSAPHVNRDFCAALVIHPERIATSKLGRSVSIGGLTIGLIKRTGINLKPYSILSNPEKIRRITIFAEGFPGGNVIFMPAALIEFVKETDSKILFPSMWPNGSFSERDETIYNTKATLAKAPVTATALGPDAILVAPEFMMKKMLAKNSDTGNLLLERLKDIDPAFDVQFEYISKPALVNIVKLTGKTVKELRSDKSTDDWIKMVLLDVKTSSQSFNLNGETLMQGTLVCSSLESATQLKGVLSEGLKRLAPRANDQKPPKDDSQIQSSKLVELLEDLASATEITQKAETLKLSIAMPKDLHFFLQRAAKMYAE